MNKQTGLVAVPVYTDESGLLAFGALIPVLLTQWENYVTLKNMSPFDALGSYISNKL